MSGYIDTIREEQCEEILDKKKSLCIKSGLSLCPHARIMSSQRLASAVGYDRS